MRIQGNIDRCEPGSLSGWILDRERPEQRVTLQVMCGDTSLGHCTADQFRADLRDAGMGDGHHSFTFKLPPHLPRAALRAIRMRIGNAPVYLLQNMPQAVDADLEPGFTHLSRFGGLWVDKLEWVERLGEMTRAGEMDEELAVQIMRFVRDGYLHIPAAVSAEAADALAAGIDAAWTAPPACVTALRLDAVGAAETVPADAAARAEGCRLDGLIGALPDARAALASGPVARLLAAIFGMAPKGFAAAALPRMVAQPALKDMARIAVPRNPLAFAGVWIALDDQGGEAGGPALLAGSHRARDRAFGNGSPWLKDAPGERRVYIARLQHEASVFNFTRAAPVLAKGDALILHAALAWGVDGGADPARPARALLGHFLPAGLDAPIEGAVHPLPSVNGCEFVAPGGAESMAAPAAAAPAAAPAEDDGWGLVLRADSVGRVPVQPAAAGAPASASNVGEGESPIPER